MSTEEQSSSSGQTTPPGSSEALSGNDPPPPYEPVHVIAEPLQMTFDALPDEALSWWARNRELIGIFIFLVFGLVMAILLIVHMVSKRQNAH
ncbi:hypothetical protein H9Q69_001884 [Fusarium xylarioides]|uniref:Uncharacterized protein n=1 Tax=Fusarium xylarioides TaxID=221167 RepID=A0A9P7HW62_9HYPO|nr:hypothetical protein H9Q70_012439 [Fusarium xylarioides]KAG5767864.1 hypothetical protein H9Q72_004428 [Fusarium xylarioides]KAG5786118.1 hypothetical protein H9Q73_000248 [Fusarium xylarioides]KAG5799054.1 hypothetical protein H9Q69_001884 [Fusarium xylarioides]KAG5803210.1 hypothetical protein H9Q71_012200 [Fusarium xylarioides]